MLKREPLSFWEDELYSQQYDLIVVGGGLTGQSTAYFFKQHHPSAKVLIVDRGFFPLGASTRNAGFACFGSVTEHIEDMKIESEEKIINRIQRRFNGLKLLRETLGDSNMDYQEPGSFEIFTDREKFNQAISYLGQVNNWLFQVCGDKNVYSISEFNGYPAIEIKYEGCLHPGKMMKKLYQLNINQGVEFRWNCSLEQIQEEERSIITEYGYELYANKIAVATNGFSERIIRKSGITPGRGYIFITNPIPDLKWKGTFHFDRGYYYFRSVGEDRLLLGGARSLNIDVETTTDFGVNEQIKNHLIDFADTILNLPDNWQIEQEWSGIMGFSKSKSPVLESNGNGLVKAIGLSGMGVALGMQLGKEAAELLQN